MARAENEELVEQFEQFYRRYYSDEIGELARRYPREQKSLHVDWDRLYQFDPDVAEDYLAQPDQLRGYAEEALRLYDLPVDVSLGQAHVRLENVEATDIRALRSEHVNTMVAVKGMVRKATDVRPKVQEAAFECQRCGTLTRVPQSEGTFQEPHECEGCERQGPFKLNVDQSEFVDAQKLRVQESPEGLRGGETPQSVDVHVEDDLTGRVTPGDHVTVAGVLRLDQQGEGQDQSPIFDIYMDGRSVTVEDEEFEDMDIRDEDKAEIVELSQSEDIYERMVDSIAPTIHGYRQEKLAIILQLFAGVTKEMPDGSRIRGDLHILLIGDPGTGKCVSGDTTVTLADGSEVPIRELVEEHIDDPTPVDDGVYDEVDISLPTMDAEGRLTEGRATKVWKREAPDHLYRIRTTSGRELEVTPSHPLFVQNGGPAAVRAEDIEAGEFVATPRELQTAGDDTLDVAYRRSRANNAVRLDAPEELTPWLARLLGYVVAEGYVQRADSGSAFVSVTNNDREILDDVADALDRLGLSYAERDPHAGKDARELVCSSSEFVSFLEGLEPALLEESTAQRVPNALMRATTPVKRAFLRAYVDAEGTVSPSQREVAVASTSRELLTEVRHLLLAFGVQSQVHQRSNDSFRLRVSGDDFGRYVERVGFVTERKAAAAATHGSTASNTNTDVVPDVGVDLRRVRETLELTQAECGLPRSTYQHYERGDRNPSRESLGTIVERFEAALADAESPSVAADGARSVAEAVASLRSLAESDLSWDRVETVETVEPEEEWVYDLEVEGTHTYLSNGVVSHNSQILQYIKNIAPRSVYTSGKGSSAAGLCVTGDTMIHTADGFVPIRSLAEEQHPEPVDEETAALDERPLYTFDRRTGTVERRSSSHVWRMPEKQCRRIETAHGKELEASVGTPVLVCGADGIEWREIGDVEAGDSIAAPKYDSLDRSTPSVRDFFEFTTEKLKPSDDAVESLRRRLREEFGTLREAAAALDLTEDFIYDSLSNRHLPQEKLDRILDAIDASLDDIAIERAMLRHGGGVRIPEEFDEDLLYLAGLVFGDGDVMVSRRGENRGQVRISNSDEELLSEAAAIIDSTFGKSVEVEYQEERVPCIRLHSATVARFFSNLGVESPKDDIALAPELTTAEHADAFLRGLFDADGSVSAREAGGSSVQFSTSDEFARQIQLMLETYGVRSRLRERDRRGTYELESGYEIESKSVQTHLAIYGADVDRFAEEIGFRSAEKAATLETIVGDAPRRGERLPLGDALMRADGAGGDYYQNLIRGDDPSRERALDLLAERNVGPVERCVREVAEAGLVWDEVVAAEDTGEKEVFDLTVPETNNFLGNGLVTHNTAAAVRDDFGDGDQWSLEAGALVLADKGTAAVDELDKMRCVSGDTLVHLGDGRVGRARELAREAAETGVVEEHENGRTVRDTDLTAWSMDEQGELVRRPVSAVHEYDSPETLREVTLQTGESLTGTANHPFFVLEDGERVERQAADLEPGDWVYVPRRVPRPDTDGGRVVSASGDPTAADDSDVVSPAFAAVLGYLSGDGNVRKDGDGRPRGLRFTNAEEELLSDFERACREAFGAEPYRPPSEVRDDGVETVRLDGQEYAEAVLEAGMNLETYDGKAFPTAVSGGPPAAKAAFLRALADSEGHVDRASDHVRLSSASAELLRGARELLLEFGVSTQLRCRERDGKRDLYTLTITDADALAAFCDHVGFTLERKQAALSTVCAAASGDRTVLDVVPEVGDTLRRCRTGLRLRQSECGLAAGTYCDFENETADVSIDRARRVLDAFESRKAAARDDLSALGSDCDWATLDGLTDRYHVSQRELADGTPYSQQAISRSWGEADALRKAVRERLREIVESVTDTVLTTLRTLVRGGVKWRRVERVECVEATVDDDRVALLRNDLATCLGCDPGDAVERSRDLLADEPRITDRETLADVLARHGVPKTRLAEDLGVAGSTVTRWLRGEIEGDAERFERARSAALDRVGERRAYVSEVLDEIDARCEPKVYDFTVEGTHNYLAEGMVVHNSEDQSAMHQALEQQEISISKAGINATLKSRCSLLGAANPTYGRFDIHQDFGEQIDLAPPLISRFDLIFTITDRPDEEEDRELAKHILDTNYAGELHTHRQETTNPSVSEERAEAVLDETEPAIDPDLMRKYIAFAQRTVFPTMTDEARAVIEEFYVDLRAKGMDEGSPVPVTARKLEALVRLAEASARVRLSDTVERADAERVTEIVHSSLQDIGVDPETGEFDADIVETGTSKTQRDRIRGIKDVIDELQAEFENGAPLEEVLAAAEEEGMERSKAEHEIESLKQKGEIYQPSQDHLRTL